MNRTVWLLASWLALVPDTGWGAARCERQPVARLALRDDAGFLSVPASIAGRAVRLMLDTGSQAGLITPGAVRALGLEADPAVRLRLQGTGGPGDLLGVALASALRLGDAGEAGGVTLGDVALPVGVLPAAPQLQPPVVGFLGGDVLGQFDLEFDLPHGWLTLWRIQTRSVACAPPPAWKRPFHGARLMASGGRLSLRVRLDGQAMRALVDTGARSRLVSEDAALRVGVSRATLSAEAGGLTSGVDLREQVYHWHRFSELVIAGDVELAPVLTVAPLAAGFDMLLGTDWLQGREVWLSYATAQLFWR